MERKILALCDPEKDYAQHMADFLRRKKDAVWEIRVFTEKNGLLEFAGEESMEILLIAESAYGDYVQELKVKLPIILSESGVIKVQGLVHIDKYQPAEKVYREMFYHYMENSEEGYLRMSGAGRSKLIGMYSPVRRCLQTTFALTFSQLLAEKHRTLYLSFEHYCGLEEWKECKRQDLSTLLYHHRSKGQLQGMHLQTIVRKEGNLDCVIPMINGENLLYVTQEEWKSLVQNLIYCGEYESVVLDLSENLQGLFEILRACDHIYTMVLEEPAALQKICAYEQLLSLQEYEDVKDKTSKCMLPVFRKLPERLEQYTKGELADYIRGMLRREEEEG